MTPPQDERTRHPSFGKLSVSKVRSSAPLRLFGSDLAHHSAVEIRLTRSDYERRHSSDSMHALEPVAVVRLTPVQWAEFISGISSGEGGACTLAYTQEDGWIDPPPAYRKAHHEVFRGEVQERAGQALAGVRDAVARLENLKKQPSIRKKDLEDLLPLFLRAEAELTRNLGFVLEQFEERTEQVVADAREEINAHVSSVVERLGLAALGEGGGGREALRFLPGTLPGEEITGDGERERAAQEQ